MILLSATIVFSAEITIQPGSEGKDSQVTSANDYNWGTRQYLTDNWGTADTRGMIEVNFVDYGFVSGHKYKVNTATWSIYHVYNNPTGKTWYLYRITGSWDEMTVKYSNKPDYDTTPVSSVVCKLSEGYEDFDVKQIVQDWLNDKYPNYGVYLYMGSPQSGITYWISSDRANADQRWKLYINYTDITKIDTSSIGAVKALFK
ncbi:MAG: DNRLRE domain-containing protein [bacterium]